MVPYVVGESANGDAARNDFLNEASILFSSAERMLCEIRLDGEDHPLLPNLENALEEAKGLLVEGDVEGARLQIQQIRAKAETIQTAHRPDDAIEERARTAVTMVEDAPLLEGFVGRSGEIERILVMVSEGKVGALGVSNRIQLAIRGSSLGLDAT